jgi:hypothetical protein
MKLYSLIFFALITCGNACGWGCEGHQIVAMIAARHLTPEVRDAVYQLLKENPIDPSLRRFCQPTPTDPLLSASTWADDSKRMEGTGTWHYMDIPRGVEHPDLMKYCAPVGERVAGKDRAGCILTGLQYELDILKDRKRPPAERSTALRYVIHFIGDMHQPLHTTTNDDQGGNCTVVTLFESPEKANLHGAWDYGIIAHDLAEKHETPEQLAGQLDQEYQEKGKKWLNERLDFARWIVEGHRIAEKTTYDKLRPKLPAAPAENGPGCTVEREKSSALKIDIDKKYAATALPVIDKQLAKAGYRLADVLNTALGR